MAFCRSALRPKPAEFPHVVRVVFQSLQDCKPVLQEMTAWCNANVGPLMAEWRVKKGAVTKTPNSTRIVVMHTYEQIFLFMNEHDALAFKLAFSEYV
jgi:hypothetical protein